MSIDIVQHLRNDNYPHATLLKRVLWVFCEVLFRISPTPLHGWRVFLLRCFGAQIGRGVRIYPSTQVTFPWNLSIADHVVVGYDVKLYALATIAIESHVLVSQAPICAPVRTTIASPISRLLTRRFTWRGHLDRRRRLHWARRDDRRRIRRRRACGRSPRCSSRQRGGG